MVIETFYRNSRYIIIIFFIIFIIIDIIFINKYIYILYTYIHMVPFPATCNLHDGLIESAQSAAIFPILDDLSLMIEENIVS